MSSQQLAVIISSREFTYLRNTDFLPDELARLINAASLCGPDNYSVRVSLQDAERLRTCFTERLAKVGFDDDYVPTREGKTLEDLIDRFYFG